MKKTLSSIFVVALFCGCAHEAVYNDSIMIAPVDESINVAKPLENIVIFIDPAINDSINFTPSSRLGSDKSVDINLAEFAGKSTYKFFKNYFNNVTISSNREILNSNSLVVIPDINNFSYGFNSKDGIDITARAFVGYNLRVKIFKNQRQIYNKNISVNELNYGDSEFFGSGNAHHAMIAPILQKSIANDYNVHAIEIIDSINVTNLR